MMKDKNGSVDDSEHKLSEVKISSYQTNTDFT